MNSERIQLGMPLGKVLIVLSEGNPGAIGCLFEIVSEASNIDPDSSLSYWGALTTLDSLGIYGSSIWVLYKDICGQSLPHMLAVLRSVNGGLLLRSTLRDACSRQDRSGKDLVPVEELYKEIKNLLPNFHRIVQSEKQ